MKSPRCQNLFVIGCLHVETRVDDDFCPFLSIYFPLTLAANSSFGLMLFLTPNQPESRSYLLIDLKDVMWAALDKGVCPNGLNLIGSNHWDVFQAWVLELWTSILQDLFFFFFFLIIKLFSTEVWLSSGILIWYFLFWKGFWCFRTWWSHVSGQSSGFDFLP